MRQFKPGISALGVSIGLALGLFSAAAVAATPQIFACQNGRNGKSVAFVYFEEGQLKSVDIRGTNIKTMNWITFDQRNSTFSYSSNGQQKFLHLVQDLSQMRDGAKAQISFVVEENGQKLTPEESLLGEARRDNDSSYGKLLFDFTTPEGVQSPGWTFSLYCQLY